MKNNRKINIKIFNGFDDELLNLWKDFEKDSANTCFQSYKYIEQYIKFFKDEKIKNIILIVELNQKIIAIFPFEIIHYFGFKILRWLGTKNFDYCGPLLCKKNFFNKNLFHEIWNDCQKAIGKIDIILLNKQLDLIDDIKNPFTEFLSNINYSKIYLIKLPAENDNYILNIENKKFLAEFLRTTKKISSNYEVFFKCISIADKDLTVTDILNKKNNLLSLKKIKNNFNLKNINFLNNMRDKYPELINLHAVYIDKKIIAANLGINYKKKFYYLIPVIFIEEFNKFSPGKLLLNYLVNTAIENKLDKFDFGYGEENYKKYWSNEIINISTYIKYKTIRGFLFYCLIKIYLIFKNIK
jgi:CelD/BcsL family acetyltransferase involved in cellulose biosynthesis